MVLWWRYGHEVDTAGVRMPAELWARIGSIATATRRSRSDVVREAVERKIADLEWEVAIIERVRQIRSGEEATIPFEAVMTRLGFTYRDLEEPQSDSSDV